MARSNDKIEELVNKTCVLARADVVNTFALLAVAVEELFFRFAEVSASTSTHFITVGLTLFVTSIVNMVIYRNLNTDRS